MAWTAGLDVTTGDLITAAQWNSYLGTSGSLNYLEAALDDCSGSAPSRSIDTIYQNTSGKIRIVTFTGDFKDGDAVTCEIGASSPPTSQVGQIYSTAGLGVGSCDLTVTFVVPPGYYYRVRDSAGSATKLIRYEWDILQ